ncbi:MAG: DUF881 domain-containing protein [Clostridia bacterium]|nr:DUF881 domain-containing protein [Clostridia bacterium]
MTPKDSWRLPLTIVFVFLGILLSAQFQVQSRLVSDLSMQKTEDLITMVRNLSDKRLQLETELIDAQSKLASIRSSRADEKKIAENLTAELNKLAIVNGTQEVKGPGLKITIPPNSPVLYVDIVGIINELWAAGAEAIAVNGNRINLYTSFYYAETENYMFITLNHKPLYFPIIIEAIGNPNTLEKGLTLPGGIIDNLILFHIEPQLEQVEELTLPAVINEPFFSEAVEVKNN